MILLYILGGIAALVVLLVLLSPVLEKNARKKAPQKLAEANKEFKQGNHTKCIDLLQDALFIPSSAMYDEEIAKHNLKVSELLKDLLKEMNIELPGFVTRFEDELDKVRGDEVKIGEEFTNPIEKLLENLYMNNGTKISSLMDMVKSGAIEVRESSKDENDFTHTLESEHSAIVNQVGRYLLSGNTSAAIDLLNSNIPASSDDATATFLEQRAGAFAMEKEYEKALADYDTILEMHPNHQRTFENIDDVKSEMKK